MINNNLNQESSNTDQTKNSKTFYIILIVGILAIVVAGFIVVNFSALSAKFSYAFSSKNSQVFESTLPGSNINLTINKNKNLLFLSSAFSYPTPAKPVATESVNSTSINSQSSENNNTNSNNLSANIVLNNILNNQLIIPNTNTRVPITWDSPTDESSLLANLKNGVVHYAGTAKPDEAIKNNSGNTFIAGHSSYYSWDDGRYNSVFANLDNLQNNDQFAIGYADKVYVYKVFEKVVVNPSDIGVVSQQTDKPIASLMTCVPVGTNLQRLIVKGEFIGYAQ